MIHEMVISYKQQEGVGQYIGAIFSGFLCFSL